MSLIETTIALAGMSREQLGQEALGLARLSLLDWMACGIAGMDEPVAVKLRTLAEQEGGRGASSLFGAGTAPARMAALVNGSTSHALDYDDTHFAHVGHLSVAIYSAALAVAEEMDAPAQVLAEAFLCGAEAAIRIGLVLGTAHYNLGFHQTATAGAFGAAVAAGRLLALDAGQMRNAIGLCATRASGLKSQFGTMGKPYNAGVAAANGVEAARLASFGMESADDGLMGLQGFVPTHTPAIGYDEGRSVPGLDVFLFEDNKYKLHACCHGTHAMIEALLEPEALRGIALDEVTSFTLQTNPRWLRVCDIKQPRTGLEVKFSYNWLAGMALRGDKTGDDRIYQDRLAGDAALVAFSRKVEVIADESLTDLQARGIVTLANGSKVEVWHDLASRIPLPVLGEKLRGKAEAMIGARGAALWDELSDLSGISARRIGEAIRARV